MMKLFDAHCHLQDPRIYGRAPNLIQTALDCGVLRFAVNGVSESDWHLVKKMGDDFDSVIPCFGLHPWFIAERTPAWFTTLNDYFRDNPSAAVGEIGLDKGSRGRTIDFRDQVKVFQQQLELSKQLKRPASIHCVRAFGDLLPIMQSMGPFPSGVILHSYLGSAEMVPEFAKLGAYFSLSGFLMSMKAQKAKKMLKSIPTDRILLETDAPDALPISCDKRDASTAEGCQPQGIITTSDVAMPCSARDALKLSEETFNHPANIHEVLNYVASLLETTKEELAEICYKNAMCLFSFQGSKVFIQD